MDKTVFIKRKTNIKDTIIPLYIYGLFFVFIITIIIFTLTTCYMKYEKEQRIRIFIEGSSRGIIKLLIKDLEIIFDHSQSLDNLLILKNYGQNKHKQIATYVIGNILYTNRGGSSLIFDLSPLTSILVQILDKEFFFRISFNDQLIITNSKNKVLLHNIDYKLINNQSISLHFEVKPNSNFIKFNNHLTKEQNKTSLILHAILFSMGITFIIYVVKQWQQTNNLKSKILNIDLFNRHNKKYLLNCHHLTTQNKLPIVLPTINEVINKIDVYKLVEEIELIVETYTNQYPYKYKLEIIAGTRFIFYPIDSIVFKQIIISLVYNLLYFMRGNTHSKIFMIKITESNIIMQYDSFAAKEEHMCNCSHDIFEHLANPYILDCKKIFDQIKKCRLDYKIEACQGKNKIIIHLRGSNGENQIIQFKKNI